MWDEGLKIYTALRSVNGDSDQVIQVLFVYWIYNMTVYKFVSST